MNLKEIVAKYQKPTEKGTEVDIKALAADDIFRASVIEKVLTIVQKNPMACVLIPAFNSGRERHHLGQLINELALTLQVRTLVTGKVENFLQLKTRPKEVIILKQSFREGNGLKDQITSLKNMGCHVTVVCFLSHSMSKAHEFAEANNVPIEVFVALDEI